MKNFAIGVDLGGTKIMAGVINTQTGEVIGYAKKKNSVQKQPDYMPVRASQQKIKHKLIVSLC